MGKGGSLVGILNHHHFHPKIYDCHIIIKVIVTVVIMAPHITLAYTFAGVVVIVVIVVKSRTLLPVLVGAESDPHNSEGMTRLCRLVANNSCRTINKLASSKLR